MNCNIELISKAMQTMYTDPSVRALMTGFLALFVSCATPQPKVPLRGCLYVSDDSRWINDTMSISIDAFSLLKQNVYFPTYRHVGLDTNLCFTIGPSDNATMIYSENQKVAIDPSKQVLTVTINSRRYTFEVNLIKTPFILISGYDFDSIPGPEPDSVILIPHTEPFLFD